MKTAESVHQALVSLLSSGWKFRFYREDPGSDTQALVASFRDIYQMPEENSFVAFNHPSNSLIDQAGQIGNFSPDGNPDAQIDLYINQSVPRSIRKILITKTGGGSNVWSTENYALYPVVVFYNGSKINSAYTSSLGAGQLFPVQTLLSLFIDSGPAGNTFEFFPLTIEVTFGDGTVVTQTIAASTVTQANAKPPIYAPLGNSKVKPRFDSAFLQDKSDSSYPKVFVILDDGKDSKLPGQRFQKEVSYLIVLVTKAPPDGETTADPIAFPYGYVQYDENKQIRLASDSLDQLLRSNDTLAGACDDVELVGYSCDAGYTFPEGVALFSVRATWQGY